jgi:hypothetical protein
MSPPSTVNEWIALKVIHPAGPTLQLPGEVAELLGFTPDVARMEKPARAVAFLDRGEGVLRAISAYRCGEMYSKELGQHSVVSTTFTSSEKFYIYLTDDVERYLKLSIYRAARDTGTDESLAWMAPAKEVIAHRKAVRLGKEKAHIVDGSFKVYLTKAIFPWLNSSVEALERRRTPTAPTVQARPA